MRAARGIIIQRVLPSHPLLPLPLHNWHRFLVSDASGLGLHDLHPLNLCQRLPSRSQACTILQIGKLVQISHETMHEPRPTLVPIAPNNTLT